LGFLKIIKNMVSEYFNGNQEIDIKVNFFKIKEMELDKWNGLMDLIILDNGKMEYRMALEKWHLVMDYIKKEYFKIIFLKAKYKIKHKFHKY